MNNHLKKCRTDLTIFGVLTARRILMTAILSGVAFASAARAAVLPPPPTPITLPPPASTAFADSMTFGPDGLLYVWTGSEVKRQSAVDSSLFTTLGTVAAAGSDAGPIAFSRDGSTILLGNGFGGTVPAAGGLVYTMPATGGAVSTSLAEIDGHYSFLAANIGTNSSYFVDLGVDPFPSSEVMVFDTMSKSMVPVITGIPGASTSMALDAAGDLVVGIGYGPQVGTFNSFTKADLSAALSSQHALDWNSGHFVASSSTTTGSGLFFAHGKLFAGGGLIGSPGGLTVFDSQGHGQLFENGFSTTLVYDPFSDRVLVAGGNQDDGVYPTSAFLVPEPSAAVLASLAGMLSISLCRRRSAQPRLDRLRFRRPPV
jgi:hypothetical protein